MISRSTDIRSALRSKQRGFLLNPYRFGVPTGPTGDYYFNKVSALLHLNGTDLSTVYTDQTAKAWAGFGSAKISTGQSVFGGASLLLDGVNSYVSTPSHADFDFGSGDFIIELRVRFTSFSGDAHIIGKYDTQSTAPFAFYRASGTGQVSFYSSTNGTSWDLVNNLDFGTLSLNTWYGLALTRTGNVWRTFRDGVLISSVTSAGTVASNSAAVTLGRGANAVPGYLAGNIDEVRITKGNSRNTASYTLEFTAFPDVWQDQYFSSAPLILHGNGANGSTVFTDSSGTPKTVTRTGSAVTLDTAQSKFGGSSIVIQSSGYLSSGPYAAFSAGAGDFTVESWHYSGSLTGDRCLFDSRSASTEGIAVYISVGGDRKLQCYNSTSLIGSAGTTQASLSAWDHWMVKRTGTTLTGWLNGVQQFTGTDSRTYAANPTIFIGATYVGGQSLASYIDDFRYTVGIARTDTSVPTLQFPDF